MGTTLIDKLLTECFARGASGLSLTAGQRPRLRIAGQWQEESAKLLKAEDTQLLMECVTPRDRVREFYERGSTEFEFRFGEAGRACVSPSRRKGNIALVMRPRAGIGLQRTQG